MRKLSYKWPVWLTLFAAAPPVFYVYHRIGKPEIFSATELAEKVVGAVGIALIVWLVYGVACLLASPLRDTSKEKPWKPSEDFHIEIHKDEGEGEDGNC